jgi:hypothetical protein
MVVVAVAVERLARRVMPAAQAHQEDPVPVVPH